MPRKLPFGNKASASKSAAVPVAAATATASVTARTPKGPKPAPTAPVASLSLLACKYGAQCYQVNPQHLAKFSHPPKASAKPDPPVVNVASVDESNEDDQAVAAESADEAGPNGKGSDNEDDADVDEDEAQDLDATSAAPTPTTSLPKPKAILADGDTRQVTSKTSSATYTIKRTGDHYYCTCPAVSVHLGDPTSVLWESTTDFSIFFVDAKWRNQGGAPVDARSCKHLKELLGEEYENARCLLNGGPPPGAPLATVKRKGTADPAASGSAAKKAKAVAPPLLLAQSWNIATGIDPTGWWISEKLDGVRAYWDPTEKKIFSRLGNAFTAPDWFLNALPTDMSLDGELFVGRKQFSQTVSIVKTHNSTKWHSLAFHVFDAPSLAAQPFEARQATLAKFVARADPGIVKLTEQTRCKDRQHVLDMLKQVEALGAEGLMLRQPGSSYEGKRSKTLLKVKTFFDAEAEVVGHEPGKGRNKGVCGALKVVMESGKQFKIGTGLDDDCRRNPPPVGSIVTYRFQELTQDKVPRFPSYVGLRVDCVAAKDYVFP